MIRALLAAAVVTSALTVGGSADAVTYRTVASKVRSVPVGGVAVVKADCPKGTKVTSGGVSVDGDEDALILGSAPFDDRDRNTRPDDGWRVVARNDSISTATVRAFAVCSRFGRHTYRSAVVDVPSGVQTTFNLLCANAARDSVVGGGATLLGSGTGLSLAGSGPFDDDTEVSDSTPDDGWTVQADNVSGQLVRMRAVAICEAEGTYDYSTTRVNVVSGGDPFEVLVSCDAGVPLAGGGGTVRGSVHLLRSIPKRVPFEGSGDGWGIAVRNETGNPVLVIASSICLVR